MFLFIATIFVCTLSVMSSQQTMTCSRTSDTFQLQSTLPSAVGPARARIGKKGPKGAKGEMGLKGSKGERGQAAPQLLQGQIEDISQNLMTNKNFSEEILRRLTVLHESLLASPDSGWFNGLNGFQYKVTPDAQSWNDSRQVCQSMGGDLATEGFRDKTRKAIFVSQFLSANLATASAWIGLSDLEEEGNFEWIDGVDSTSENTFWFTSSNEPNGGSGENCVEMYSSLGQHKYNDNNCALSFKAFCAKRLDL